MADITRAVDDKTARDLLGENFRRQLLMDGQYGALSFICTKTDVIKSSEIRRYMLQFTTIFQFYHDQGGHGTEKTGNLDVNFSR